MVKKVFIVNGDLSYTMLFKSLGYEVVSRLTDSDHVDLMCFTGGADVDPVWYGAAKHQYTNTHIKRDTQEKELFDLCVFNNIPMVGICRGGQFLNVMSGGEMYQHVTDHGWAHTITDVLTGEQVYVSSTHHQMMKPTPEAVLVAFAAIPTTREWYEGEVFRRDVSETGIEVVYYEKTKALCFQPHPEFESAEYEGMRRYFGSLLERFFN